MSPWLTMRREPVSWLTQLHERAILSAGRMFSSSVRLGMPLMQATSVSLSRKTSLMKFSK